MARLSRGATPHSRTLRLGSALRHALDGIRHAWQTEPNFRLETAVGALALLLALWLGVNLAPVLLAVGLVLSLELLNTAIEATVDLASPEPHPLAKTAKDTAAAAVLTASVAALLLGLYLFLPPLWERLAR